MTMVRPEKQTVLIAGATGNIGFAAAVALVERGVRVVLIGRNADRLRAKEDLLWTRVSNANSQMRKGAVESLIVDFADTLSVRCAAGEVLRRFARIDGIVHSVGVFLQNGPKVMTNGHEVMFATNVVGPFQFTELLFEKMADSGALVAHVIAGFNASLDWSDLESIADHRPMKAFNRTKVCNRMIAGEMSRRHAGRVSHLAFDPTFVIDKSDPELNSRWPNGFTGMVWRTLSLVARPPAIAGEPLADLFTHHSNRASLNGKLYRLSRQVTKVDAAMQDSKNSKLLWEYLARDMPDPIE